MKKTKYRRLAAMAASLLCCLIFTVPAYAQSSEPQPETAPAPAETEAEPETQNPFTPDGTGTVVDNATDEDGKEFYTIMTDQEIADKLDMVRRTVQYKRAQSLKELKKEMEVTEDGAQSE